MSFGKVGEAYIEFVARLEKYEAGLRHAKTITEQAAQGIETATEKKMVGGFQRAGMATDALATKSLALIRTIQQIAVVYGGVKLVRIADDYQQLGRRIGIAVGDVKNFTAAQEQVYEIAQRTGQPIEALGVLVSRLGPTFRGLGKPVEDLFQTVETLSKIIAVSGASAAEADSAIRQLGQALGSGRLSGDEFRSVAEQFPIILDAIAESTGKTRFELKAMADEQLLTTPLVLEALEKYRTKANQAFEEAGDSVSKSVIRVQNAFQNLIGTLDTALGATSRIASGINYLAGIIDGLANSWSEALAAMDARAAIEQQTKIAEKQAKILELTKRIEEERAKSPYVMGVEALGIDKGRERRIAALERWIAQLRKDIQRLIKESHEAAGEIDELTGAVGIEEPAGGAGLDVLAGDAGQDRIAIRRRRPRAAPAASANNLQALMLSAAEPTGEPSFSARLREQLEAAQQIADQFATAQQTYAKRQAQLDDLLKRGLIDIETYSRATADAQRNALVQGANELRQYGTAWDGVRASLMEYQAAVNDTAQVASEATTLGLQAVEQGLAGLGAALIEGKAGWEQLGQAANQALAQIINQLLQLAIRQAVIAPLLRALGGDVISGGAGGDIVGGSGVGGDTLAARGMAFDGGIVERLARGGLVTTPTRFRFSGGTAIAGELGTEAILPLKRTRSGALGVQASGGAPKVELHVHNEHPSARVEQTQERGPNGDLVLRAYIREAVAQEIARGAMRAPMQQDFGLRPSIHRRG